MYSLTLIFINNPTAKEASTFPLPCKETEIPTMPMWWLAFTHRFLCHQHLCSQLQESRGSLSRELRETSLPRASCPHMQSNSQQTPFGYCHYQQRTFHGGVCHQSLSHRRLPRLAKSTTPAGLIFVNDKQELSSPLLYLCVPPKYTHGSSFFCRPSRKQNNSIIECWHPPPN